MVYFNLAKIIGDAVGDAIANFFYKILFLLLSGLCKIVNSVQDALLFITGAKKVTLFNGEKVSMIEALFGISEESNGKWNLDFNNPVQKAFLAMLLLFVFVLVFSLIAGSIKINLNRQDKEALPSMQKLLWKSVLSFGIVVMLPILFCLLLSFVGLMSEFINEVLGNKLVVNEAGELKPNETSDSITTMLFKACIDGDQWALIKDKKHVGQISSTMSVNKFADLVGGENVHWVMYTLGVCCMVIGLVMACTTVAERIINIILLYLIAPAVIGTIPLDDGKRWDNWKDVTISKVISASGNIISIYIYIYIMTFFGTKFIGSDETITNDGVMIVCFLFLTIAGAFMSAKGGTLIATLISSNSGQQEGMSFQATSSLLGMGGKVAGATAATAAAFAFGKSRSGNTTLSKNANRSSYGGTTALSGIGGNNLPNSEGAYEYSKSNPAEQYNQSKGRGEPLNNREKNSSEASVSNQASLMNGLEGGNMASNSPNNESFIGKVASAPGKTLQAIKEKANIPSMIKGSSKLGKKAIVGAGITVGAVFGSLAARKHLANTVGGVKDKLSVRKNLEKNSKRAKEGYGNIDVKQLGNAALNKDVKKEVAEINKANKDAYIAKNAYQKAEKQLQKADKNVELAKDLREKNLAQGKDVSKVEKKLVKAQELQVEAQDRKMNTANAFDKAETHKDEKALVLGRTAHDVLSGSQETLEGRKKSDKNKVLEKIEKENMKEENEKGGKK